MRMCDKAYCNTVHAQNKKNGIVLMYVYFFKQINNNLNVYSILLFLVYPRLQKLKSSSSFVVVVVVFFCSRLITFLFDES